MTKTEPVVHLFTRHGCHLCVEARKVLERLSKRHGFTVQERDATEAGVPEDWRIQVPIIAYGEEILSSVLVDEEILEKKLKKRLARPGAKDGSAK